MHNIISIAKQFSEFPTGRFYTDTKVSGQFFRDKFLVAVMQKGIPTLIDLDGVEGYGSSFLEESFGGLLREGFKLSEVSRLITYKAEEDPSVVLEIEGYLLAAENIRLKKMSS